MISVGHIDVSFGVKAQGMDVCFDPNTEEQFLSFKVALTASLPQLLQQLLEFQQRDAAAAAALPAPPPPLAEASSMMRMYGQAACGATGLTPVSIPLGQQPRPQQPQLGPPQLVLPPQRAAPPQPPPLGPPQLTQQHMGPQALGQQAPHQVMQQAQLMQPALPPQGALDNRGNTALNMALIEALRSDNLLQARQLLQQRADVNYVEAAPTKRTPLLHALEVGGRIDAVNLLLKAKANVNAVMSRGKTALHLAIQQYLNLPPLVIRMLLCHKADLSTPDARGVTPLDSVRIVSMQSCQQGQRPREDASIRVRQLLSEVTELPTVDIVVVDGQHVQSALFADVHNDKVVFNTESSIGVYSLVQRRVVLMKKLKQQQVASTVKHISVNPEFGTIAVCLELLDLQQNEVVGKQNVFIVWPNGQLQDEEPLKLNIKVDPQPCSHLQPACVMLSRCQGPQMLLGRLVDGKIFCWHLNSARSQLVSETELMKNGGIVAISDNGCWIAVVSNDDDNGTQVTVFSYESPEGLRTNPEVIAQIGKNPQGMAIQQTGESVASCYLALSEVMSSDGAPPPIEVYSLSVDGAVRSLYRLKAPSLCYSLTFCHRTSIFLLSGHIDGLVVVYDLLNGTTSLCHDCPGTGFLSICTDRSLIVSTSENYFRIFKVPAAELSS